jgi:hypothetical protein
MLKSLNEILHFSIQATDGKIGHVHDFLFTDETWAIRYMVVDTGNWLPGRKVLVPVNAFHEVDWNDRAFKVEMDRETVENQPDIDTDIPVSRQQEEKLHDYYGWFPYWQAGIQPVSTGMMVRIPDTDKITEEKARNGADPHLRSTREIHGYHIAASDGKMGHIDDLLADEEEWVIRFLVVDTKNWWPSKSVLLSPASTFEVDWKERLLHIDRSREEIKDAPEYDPLLAIDRDKEEEILRFYGMPKYWL